MRVLRPVPVVVALVTTVLFAALGSWMLDLAAERHDGLVAARVAQGEATVFALLDSELTGTLHLGPGLAGLIAYDPLLGSVADEEGPVGAALARVFAEGEHLRNIGLAPGNVLRHVYPLAGNEAAIGLRYEDVPAQWADVERAMATGTTVLAGPVDLVQGGRGLISRTPVFLDDGDYWGVISLVIDLDSLVASVDDASVALPVDWAVRTAATPSQPSIPVSGDQTLFDRHDDVTTLTVPGGAWEVVAGPNDAATAGAPPLGLGRVAIVLTALVIGALVLLSLVQREGFRELSLHDALTGLPNRRLLHDRLDQALRDAERDSAGCTVLVLDLDGFKRLNDQLGHAAGDAALLATASTLRDELRGADTVGRLGGDEFVVVLPRTPLATAVDVVAPRVLARLTRTVEQGDRRLPISVTIGVAHAPTHGGDPATLLRAADAAMYEGKRAGRGGVSVAVAADRRTTDRPTTTPGGEPVTTVPAARPARRGDDVDAVGERR